MSPATLWANWRNEYKEVDAPLMGVISLFVWFWGKKNQPTWYGGW